MILGLLLSLGEVGLDADRLPAELLDRRDGFIHGDHIDDRDIRARLRKADRIGLTDTTTAAGNHRDLAVQLELFENHFCFLSFVG